MIRYWAIALTRGTYCPSFGAGISCLNDGTYSRATNSAADAIALAKQVRGEGFKAAAISVEIPDSWFISIPAKLEVCNLEE